MRHIYVVRSTTYPGEITLRFVLVILVARPLGMLFARWRKGCTSSRGSQPSSPFVKMYGPSTPSRLTRLSSVPSAVIASPVFSNKSLRYSLSESSFATASPTQCVSKALRSEEDSLLVSHFFHVVALLVPRLETLPHPQLDQSPVSCIDRLHLIRAPWWQQPKQNVASLLEIFL